MTTAVQHYDPGATNVCQLRPLFILSVWRSGSSLLYALLNQHSQIALLYEGELPQLQHLLRGHFRTGRWREKWEFWNQGPSRHNISINSMPSRVADAWDATRIVYQEFARRKQAVIWGEKSPHWYDSALRIATKFPDAQFIFLWRDPNSVMESVARAAEGDHFFRKPGFLHRVLVGTERLRHAYEVLRSRGRSVYEINYEDLTSNPTKCMKRICKFLDVRFEPKIATLETADCSACFSGLHHAMVRGNRIVGNKEQARRLSTATQAKIARYISRWSRLSGGEWPKYPVPSKSVQPPGVLELLCDSVVYRALLWRDDMVKLTYGILPVASARSVRSWVRQPGLGI